MAHIYKIENLVNGKIYIGSTVNYKRRCYQHKTLLNNNKHGNPYLQNAWNKYGKDNFKFDKIEECLDEDRFKREEYYFKKLNPFDKNGYNLSLNAWGGGNNIGEKAPNSINTEKQVLKAKYMLSKNIDNKEIIKCTGISKSSLCTIKFLRSWVRVGLQYNKQIIKNNEINNKKSKIQKKDVTEDILQQAYELYKNGTKKNKQICEKLGLESNALENTFRIYKAKKAGKTTGFCIECNKEIVKKSNSQKYCAICRKKKDMENHKKSYEKRKNNKK